jgi:hypothetical protein
MEHNEIVSAIQFIRPTAIFSLFDNNLVWLDENQTEPTDKEIEKGWLDYQSARSAAQATKAAEKAAATAKLAALGLTEDDLKALGLGGN